MRFIRCCALEMILLVLAFSYNNLLVSCNVLCEDAHRFSSQTVFRTELLCGNHRIVFFIDVEYIAVAITEIDCHYEEIVLVSS